MFMKWIHLFDKIGKQPLSTTNHENVYALLNMNDGLGEKKVYLKLEFDDTGKPYMVEDKNVKENSELIDKELYRIEDLRKNIGKKVKSRRRHKNGIIKDVKKFFSDSNGCPYVYQIEWPDGKITNNKCSNVEYLDDNTLQLLKKL